MFPSPLLGLHLNSEALCHATAPPRGTSGTGATHQVPRLIAGCWTLQVHAAVSLTPAPQHAEPEGNLAEQQVPLWHPLIHTESVNTFAWLIEYFKKLVGNK